ncbi:BAM_G0005960.mRNA.1.CDS.1 [Saccharomyces cerevisiae]|nr:BAM_G0005960.mRNA.1.CDS.1 [Saccharomyces cerevisiae]CAI7055719.1 BAM_G0005960.mRNA.1.CDS.1 [Saccharomyces cerevisiae]
MIESNVLTPQEMSAFRFNSLGELRNVWDTQVVRELKESVENNTCWRESKDLHSKLSKMQLQLSTNKNNENSSQLRRGKKAMGPAKRYLFELFETIDYNRFGHFKTVC